MLLNSKLNKLSFLVYGLGLTGQSVVKFFERNKIKNYTVWDDNNKTLFKNKRTDNLKKNLEEVDYIILSPGISLKNSKYKKILTNYKDKIITDIDLIFLKKKNFKSIVVTGTNGKSTTCKLIYHVLKKNGFQTAIGGNIGKPILNISPKNNQFLVIEASSFQLAHSKFISPDYAFLLNITNDHIDWHGSMKNYFNAKFRIFQNQEKYQYSFLNKKFESHFKKRNFLGKLIIPKIKRYKKIKPFLKNTYLSSNINDENMSHIFALANLLKITNKSFLNSLNSFKGLPHRYEIFLKRKNCIFINDSKATSFEATKFALKYTKNIYWILGGLPKKKDKIILRDVKKNIKRSYIIGKNINFFKNQIQNQINFYEAKTLKNSIVQALKDISNNKEKNISLLFSPASASFDQFLNFEKRGEEFKKLSRFYARKYI